MNIKLAQIILWLFVINLGIDFGAGLYEARIEIPQWLTWSNDLGAYVWNAEAAIRSDVGLRFWAFVSTGPLTLLTLASFFFARKVNASSRKWWLIAASVTVAERLFTFSFFIPTMISLTLPEVTSTPEVVAKAILWSNLNGLRHLLTLISLLAGLNAISFVRDPKALSV